MVGHAWRSLLFGIDGWRHYLKSGYASASKRFDDAPFATDLRGRHYVITGANQGIGYATAKQLASQNASVHMVCRDRARGEAALAKLRAELAPPPGTTTTTAAGAGTPGPALTLHVCDVSLQRDVAAFADAYARSGAPLHCLVNNAGCMVHERTATREGVETNFATNTLGAYNLTRLLEPALRRAGAEARVVFVASAGALTERLDVEDVESERKKTFDATRAYAKQKRHQMALCERFAEAEEESGKKKSVETASTTTTEERKSLPGGKSGNDPVSGAGYSIGYYCMHPGWSDTEAVRVALPGFYDALRDRLRSPAEGADTVAWLCVAPKSELRSGGFYLDRRETPAHVSASAWFGTRYSREDVDALIRVLDEKTEKALSHSDAPSTNNTP